MISATFFLSEILSVSIGWQWRTINDSACWWQVDFDWHGIPWNKMCSTIPSRCLHENHLLQTVVAQYRRCLKREKCLKSQRHASAYLIRRLRATCKNVQRNINLFKSRSRRQELNGRKGRNLRPRRSDPDPSTTSENAAGANLSI